MRERPGFADLLAQEFERVGTLTNLLCQDFDRESLAFDLLVARQVDNAHTAFTQLSLEAVAPAEQVAGRDRSVGYTGRWALNRARFSGDVLICNGLAGFERRFDRSTDGSVGDFRIGRRDVGWISAQHGIWARRR